MKEAWYTQFFTISWLANALYAVASILTTMLVIFGFKRVEAQLGSLLLLAELPFVVLFGWLFYQEIPSYYSVIGGILILVSMSIPNIKLKAFRLAAEHK